MEYEASSKNDARVDEICAGDHHKIIDGITQLVVEVMNEKNEDEFIAYTIGRIKTTPLCLYYEECRLELVAAAGSDRLLATDCDTIWMEFLHINRLSKERLQHVVRFTIAHSFNNNGWEAYKDVLNNHLHSRSQELIYAVLAFIKTEYGLNVSKLLEEEPDDDIRVRLSILYPEEV